MRNNKGIIKADYRHYICTAITLVFLGCGFLFPNAIPRLAESVWDGITSVLYYLSYVVLDNTDLVWPTVTELPSWEFAESPWEPLSLFPWTWEEFKVLWSAYWTAFVSEANFAAYIEAVGDFLYKLSKVLLILLPLDAAIFRKLRSYTNVEPNKRKGESKPLRRFKRFSFKVIYPVVAWIKDFVFFVRENKRYLNTWITLWLLYFNVLSIVISFVAYFFYFSASFDIISLYTQVLKLFIDLTPMIRFLPGIVWLGVGAWIYNYVCRDMAFLRLYAYERSNRAFLKKRGIVTTVYGEMGTGKTQLITSMALSAEIEQWDAAYDIMLERELMFPNFPWQNVRDYLKREIEGRRLCDIDAVRARFRTYQKGFDWILSEGFDVESWRAYRRNVKIRGKRVPDYTFGYDFEHYRYTYNDELKITHLFEAVSDYAQAYLVFTVRTSLIFSNYSIRVDSMLRDFGNMPYRDNDFLERDVRDQDYYSRRSHIINYDMLRLGRKMQKEFKLSFGVFVITEIDKERKNAVELQEEKKKGDEVNQKNDLFNSTLMMCRHAAVIANRVFIRIIADLQRPEAWGAGGRELGEVIYIEEAGTQYPALPFLSPYWLFEGVFSWLKAKWRDFHSKYNIKRRDGTLFAYAVDNVTSVINNHYDKVRGKFGTFTLKLQVQSGRMDGGVTSAKWHIITKKDRSARYKTDCLSSVFATYTPNTMHIDDFICYAGNIGTLEENGLQNSYFQNDVHRMKQRNREREQNKAA